MTRPMPSFTKVCCNSPGEILNATVAEGKPTDVVMVLQQKLYGARDAPVVFGDVLQGFWAFFGAVCVSINVPAGYEGING